MHGLFVTGTDTGVGKTWLAAAVARLLRRQGWPVRVCKPVATGALEGVPAEDTRLLADAAGDLDLHAVTPWTLIEAAAPPVAARLAGVELKLDEIVKAVRQRVEPGVAVLVEGVGGLLCPLTEHETVADLAAALGMQVIIVARRSLGTLNHTLLTLAVARSRGLEVAGVVVNETTPACGVAEETNPQELRQRMTVPLLAVIPHGQDGLAALADVDWWGIVNKPQTGATSKV
jgi:dethiobiotin synthetase